MNFRTLSGLTLHSDGGSDGVSAVRVAKRHGVDAGVTTSAVTDRQKGSSTGGLDTETVA